ncbi:hypothetical protein CQW23_13341 [Capsicum baccatum]|uniref:Protein-tyrosine-phosphatase MKP1 C-terminal domain-containing protein n=1 Tax=Capsicum baccatum TaxID=33114 RepID=A0A2G2WV72_CAPBA|nr:hypothetical protein CQW23_13341 [Capsicum baccatum]
MLNDPSPSELDSRGAFIIHIPSAIYVWIGKKSEAIMERDARGAVSQIVHYVKVQAPIITVMEGEEPLYFWDAFSNFLPLTDKLKNGGDVFESSNKVCPGERKVDTYNVDFEIFQKATSGGVVPPFSSCDAEHETHLPVRESSWSILRRKSVSGNMNDFVFSTKSGISTVYPDSMFITIDNCATKQLHSSCMLSSSSSCSSSPSTISLSSKSSSSSSSSASSPPYPSPDSILSDSSINSKCLSDSPAVSPSVICADLTSSTPCNSSVSVLPPKISLQSISKTSKYIDVNFASQNSSQSAPALSKKFPLSIAERRGSLSKCLKLPMLTDDFERKGVHLKSVANEQGDIGLSEVTNESFNEAATAGEILQSLQEIIESKVDELHRSLDILGVDNPSDKEATVFGGFHESWEKKPCNESSSAVLNGVVDTSGACCNLVKPVVYRLGKDASRAVHVLVGRSFSCDFSEVRQVDCKGTGDPGEIDWKQAASDVLHQMVLPIDSNIKHLEVSGSFNSQQRQTPGDFFPSVLALVDSDTWYLLLAGGGRYFVELVEVKLDCTIQIERSAMLLEFLVETACYMHGKAEDANVTCLYHSLFYIFCILRRLMLEVVRDGSPECTCYSAATPDDRLRGNSLTRLFVVNFP